MDAVKRLVKDGRFWVAVLTMITGGLLFARGEIDANTYAVSLAGLGAIVVGALTFEKVMADRNEAHILMNRESNNAPLLFEQARLGLGLLPVGTPSVGALGALPPEAPGVILPPGVLVKINGFPFRTLLPTRVEGTQANLDAALASGSGQSSGPARIE